MADSMTLNRYSTLRTIVHGLEIELKRLELWEDEPPRPDALASQMPFACDRLMFHQWLRWQFIPRMQKILAGHGALPIASDIFPYALHSLSQYERDPNELLFLVRSFDEVIKGSPRSADH